MAACAVADLLGRDGSIRMRFPDLCAPVSASLTEFCEAVECAFPAGVLSSPRGGAGSGGHFHEW